MEIWHRISFNGDTKHQLKIYLDKLSIKYRVSPLPNHKLGLIYFDIAESNPRWAQLASLIRDTEVSDVYDTIFTEEEILQSRWNRLIPVFQQGYPQPERSWSVNPITYEGHCPECGVYKKHKESFRIKKEPRLGKNNFMSLYWTYALFTTPSVFTEFAKHQIKGYRIWDVLIHKTSQPSETISQVYIPNLTEAILMPDDNLTRKICSRCRTAKYFPHMRGYMQFTPELSESDLDFMLTREWFGDGGTAFREILVSKKLARLILENKWRGARLKPVR